MPYYTPLIYFNYAGIFEILLRGKSGFQPCNENGLGPMQRNGSELLLKIKPAIIYPRESR